ncbi:hypothetical protein B5S32_g1921 [[Candida] boidinii]|nr:hypothetical protein B5S32_g1921 [[Candida] boidinii]
MSYNETFKVIPVYEPYDRFVFCSKSKSDTQQQDSKKGKFINNVYYNGEIPNTAYSSNSTVDLNTTMKIKVTDSKPKKTLAELVKTNRKPKRKKLNNLTLNNHYSPLNKQFFDNIKTGLIEVVKCVLKNGGDDPDILPIPIQRCHQDILSLIRQRETSELLNQVHKLIEEHFQSIDVVEKILDVEYEDFEDSELNELRSKLNYKINKNFNYKDCDINSNSDYNSDFDIDEIILTNIKLSNFIEVFERWQSTINLINYIFLPFINNTNYDSNRQNKESIKEFGMRLFLDELFRIKSKSASQTIVYHSYNSLELENLFDINTQNFKTISFNYLIFQLLKYHLLEKKEIIFNNDNSFSVVSKKDPLSETLNSVMKILIKIQHYVNNNVKDSNNFQILKNFQLILIKVIDFFKGSWVKESNLNYFNNSRILISSISNLLNNNNGDADDNNNVAFPDYMLDNTIRYLERRLIYDYSEDESIKELFGKIFQLRNDNAKIYKDEEEEENDESQGIFISTFNVSNYLSKEEIIKIYNIYQSSRIEKRSEDLNQFIESNSNSNSNSNSVNDDLNILNNSILPNDLKIIDYFLSLIKKENDLKLIFRFRESKSEIYENLINTSIFGFLDKNFIKIFEKLISNNSKFDNILHDKLLKYIDFYINNIYNPKKFDLSNINLNQIKKNLNNNKINNNNKDLIEARYDNLLSLNIFENKKLEIFHNQNFEFLIQCNKLDNENLHIENLINFYKTKRLIMK